ncbi:hypothetical protein Tco_0742001 [Tanacetum coccineum]
MFNRENVDYPELIWEDFAYQIDHRKEKRSRRKNMPYPRFTKIIINHFLKQHKSLTNLNHKHYHTIKDDETISRLKFVRIGEDYQEYRLPILDVMLTDAIKCSESYQMFIKYSTHQILPKKSRGKESEPEPEPVKKKTASRRVVKKKVTLSADDNIISDDPDAALELAKSISQTEVEEAKAARKVYVTYARIVTESVSKSDKKKSSGRSYKNIVIQDNLSAPKSKPATSKTKLKGTRGSNEGTGSKLGVPDESTVISATSSEGTGSEHSDDDNDDIEKDDRDGDVDDEGDDHISDTQDANDEDVKTESDEEDIYKYKICVRKDKDEEMINAEVDDSDKGDKEITDAAKADAEKSSEAKDDVKKTELSPSSSSLSVSSGFGDQFLKISSDSSLVSTVKDSVDIDVSSLLDIPIQQETPRTESPSAQKVPVLVIPKTTNLPPIHEILTETPVSTTVSSPLVTPIISSVQQTPTPIPTQTIITDAPTITTTVLESNALTAVELRVAKLEKDVSKLKTVDHSAEALAILKYHVPSVVDNYLGSKVGDVFQKELKKQTTDLIQKYYLHQFSKSSKKQTLTVDLEQGSKKSASEILQIKREQAEKQQNPKFTIKSTDKAALEEYDLKSALYQSMHANKYFNRNPANHRLYHALTEALIKDENAMDKEVADTVKDHKRKHDNDKDNDDEDPLLTIRFH